MEHQQSYTAPELPPRNPGKFTVTVDHAGRLQSLLDVLPTTIASAAKKLRSHPAWRRPDGRRPDLGYLMWALREIVKGNRHLINARFEDGNPTQIIEKTVQHVR